uniref:Uncharacterized protein n=1 Tax=Acrobeloides nanus TaxID=290746 RepID=A0A914DXI1_9BILA
MSSKTDSPPVPDRSRRKDHLQNSAGSGSPSVTFSLHHQAANGSLSADERTPSQFNPSAFESPSLNSRRESQRRGSVSNLSEQHGALVLYDPQMHSIMPTGFMPPPPPPPLWYPPPMSTNGLPMYFCPGPPPPPTVALPPDPAIIRKAIKEATKLEKKKLEASKLPSPCCQFCCGGVAQLMWTIIAIVLMGFIAALVLAFFVV